MWLPGHTRRVRVGVGQGLPHASEFASPSLLKACEHKWAIKPVVGTHFGIINYPSIADGIVVVATLTSGAYGALMYVRESKRRTGFYNICCQAINKS